MTAGEAAEWTGEWAGQGIDVAVHDPTDDPSALVVLAHGAGSDRNAPVLVAVATELASRGLRVVRTTLPFRQQRPTGPPNRAGAAADRAGIAAAVEWAVARERRRPTVIVGGHSYGGRQASMLAAENPAVADGLLLLSYPLHPPRKPDVLRVDHFPAITVPTVVVHGSKDPFATSEELTREVRTIPASVRVVTVEGAGHDLAPNRKPTATLTADAVEGEWVRREE
ncbi:alpha/beta hydrolase family protein [Rhodococcoides corynebacterioides]|uniref:Alpha/beta fold hydrolase n=1 Tax=Rhodococcoides corynebacterioides TaxID=53972 RepID=A0ABS7P7R1_9NOCA|nr:alpha/beta fold hydrolase [Rhodococcus corynebacterioides]MBY6368462.1 alpha/beta fold hydrolase [Rhodococcus corynebacterioides]MBY6409498.1 alpha/beta fold hydrolase [Rhodococcus corynebacterioides]